MSDAETKQGEEITTLDNHAPTPPADDTIVTLDNHAPTPPADDTIVTLDNHAPAPPALGLDGK
ncbi:sigma-like protein [Streptomyces sp. NPDC005549]|uniref:sigma-like protein n=1 Tax=Streptomyces sp. NPDC005549 TaxID=3154888 RepID=UPI0033B75332